ncbi:uncharacterized protein [Clytia hemisphaerica]|uniref:Uncharacterized protein n=2 Tax=Clytia hemisphaerica TaxID=252671 RepID=A0A7M5TYY2_9CNID|eukprot:TCONS_00024041-protein
MNSNGNNTTTRHSKEENASMDLFEDVLLKITKELNKQQFKKLKHSLMGHMDQNLLNKIRNSKELIFYLRINRLLCRKKLAFFRKLLMDIPGCQRCLKWIDNYRKIFSQQKLVFEKEMMKTLDEIDELRIIENRQMMSEQQYQALLDRHEIKYNQLKSLKDEIIKELNTIDETSEDLKLTKKTRLAKYREAQKTLNAKQDALSQEKDHLLQLKEQCQELNNKLDAFKVNQNLKGELRLNAFQRTLERDEMNAVKRAIKDKRHVILEQKQVVMKSEEDMDELVKNVDFRRGKVREILAKVRCIHTEHANVYEKLEDIEKKILNIKNKVSTNCQSMLEIELELVKTREALREKNSFIEEADDVAYPTNNSNDETGELPTGFVDEKRRLKIDYDMLGSKIYSIGNEVKNDLQESAKTKLNQPFFIAVDQNGNLVVMDGCNKTGYRIVNIGFNGETNFEIGLDTLEPVDLAIDLENCYYVTGRRIIRKYQQTELVLQFVPHYLGRTMDLPEISCIKFNVHTSELYLLDKVNKGIHVYDLEGHYKNMVDLSEYVVTPSKFTIQDESNILVTDCGEHSVHMYRISACNVLECQTVGSLGIGDGEFVQPTAIFFDDGSFTSLDQNEKSVVAELETEKSKSCQFVSMDATRLRRNASDMSLNGFDVSDFSLESLDIHDLDLVEELKKAQANFDSVVKDDSTTVDAGAGIEPHNKCTAIDAGENSCDDSSDEPDGVTDQVSRHIIVCDTGNHRICVLKENGDFRTSFGRHGTSLRSFKCPNDVCVFNGLLLVADKDNDRVLIFFS